MKRIRGALVLLLSYALGVQPVVAQVRASISAPAAAGVGAAAASALGASGAASFRLQALALTPSAGLSAALFVPALAPSVPPSAANAAAVAAVPALTAPAAAAVGSPASALAAATPAERVASIQAAANRAVYGLERASVGGARGQADVQFAALTADRLAAASSAAEAPLAAESAAAAPVSLGKSVAPAAGAAKADVPAPQAPKRGYFQVFRDPERNKSFWSYMKGYCIFLLGMEMYVVGQPYLVSSMVTNSLKEKHDARGANPAVVTEMIRTDRSLTRIFHWVAQFFSYALNPLFSSKEEQEGPKKWLVRSMLIRSAALAVIPALFFATGVLGVAGSLWLMCGLVAAQSFFQGISVTTEGAATTRLLGDKSVTAEERTHANAIMTVFGSVIAIIGPVLAGQISRIGPVRGKTGVGGAVIYALYSGALGLTGLIYAGIKMFGGPGKDAAKAAAGGDRDASAPVEKKSFKEAVAARVAALKAGLSLVLAAAFGRFVPKGFIGPVRPRWISIKDGLRVMFPTDSPERALPAAIKDGLRIVFKDRLLRTLVLMSTIESLFSDPLVFNVLPEYMENLVARNPAGAAAIMKIPLLGWFLHGLTSTPMGNFALMVTMASVGSIVAALTIKPLTKLIRKFGFKTEEALTIPFYFLAALEAPLFFLMIHTPSILGAVVLYGLQSLVIGFVGIAVSGLYQKNLGGQKDENVNKILAATSLVGIAAAILSTYVYGFVLKDIPIATSLIIAAIATAAVSVVRVAAPYLSFSKSQRNPPAPPEPPARVAPAHAMPSTGDHNGPHSILSNHL
ncbi:MAG: hypothetical protein ACHQ49_10400 [Elusimicrobiota bacterium]